MAAFFALILALSLAVIAPSQVAAAGTRTISGTVVEGTAGASLPAGLSVSLKEIDQKHQVVAEQKVQPDAAGHFAFANVTEDPALTYVVSTSYAGVPYLVAVPSAGASQPIQLKIYEPTTSDAAIRIESADWLLESVDEAKQQAVILDVLTVVNGGDRVYVGDHRGDPGSGLPAILPRTLRLTLPQAASDFKPELGLDPSKLLPVANGYVDTSPVLPGKHQLAYSFTVGYAEGVAEVQSALAYPTTTLRFLAPAGLGFRSDHLSNGGTVKIQGQTYQVLTASHLKANTTVTVDVVGLPAVSANRLSPEDMRIGGLILIVLAIALALYLGLGARRARPADPLASRRAMLAAIAELDDQYAAGQLDQASYRTERARRKEQLIESILGRRVAGADAEVAEWR